MEVYEAINSRRTVRDFQERSVDRETIRRVLGAGLRAPSNDHLRSWEFILVDDPATRVRLLEKIPKRSTKKGIGSWLDSWGAADPVQRAMYFEGVPKQHRMLLSAGTLIIPCFRQAQPLLRPDSLSALNAFAAIWCCIENILIAAVAEGLFGVTRIPFAVETPHIRSVLEIPEDYEIPCYLALGYPAAESRPVQQLPIRIEERMHFNAW